MARCIVTKSGHGCEVSQNVRRPGLEPGPSAWEAEILPLNYRRCGDRLSAFNGDSALYSMSSSGPPEMSKRGQMKMVTFEL